MVSEPDRGQKTGRVMEENPEVLPLITYPSPILIIAIPYCNYYPYYIVSPLVIQSLHHISFSLSDYNSPLTIP